MIPAKNSNAAAPPDTAPSRLISTPPTGTPTLTERRSPWPFQTASRVPALDPSMRVMDYGAGTGLVALQMLPVVGEVVASTHHARC